MRRWFTCFLFFTLAFSLFPNQGPVQAREEAKEAVFICQNSSIQVGQFGRFKMDAILQSEPNSNINVKEGKAGEEFSLVDTLCVGIQRWWNVELLSNGGSGWVEEENVDSASQDSTESLREYENGFCVATPTEARAVRVGGFLSVPQHWLYFDSTVHIPTGTATLSFNNKPVAQTSYTLFTRPSVAIKLSQLWSLEHSGLKPIWSQKGYWQLSYRCSSATPEGDLGQPATPFTSG